MLQNQGSIDQRNHVAGVEAVAGPRSIGARNLEVLAVRAVNPAGSIISETSLTLRTDINIRIIGKLNYSV